MVAQMTKKRCNRRYFGYFTAELQIISSVRRLREKAISGPRKTSSSDIFDEGHAVDLMKRSHARMDLLERGLPEAGQAFLLRLPANLRSGSSRDDHLPYRVGHIEKFVDRRPPSVAGVIAGVATDVHEEILALHILALQPGFQKFLVAWFVRAPARGAKKAD